LIISNTETKELKKRVRDIIEPGRDLGHVDGKKKSIAGATLTEHQPPDSNEKEDNIDSEAQRQEKKGEDEVLRPGADSNTKVQGQESRRKFTPMDMDTIETRNESGETQVKNTDGSLCEDCK
jgi:hypothetical protein